MWNDRGMMDQVTVIHAGPDGRDEMEQMVVEGNWCW